MYEVTMKYNDIIKYFELYMIDMSSVYFISPNKLIDNFYKNIISYKNIGKMENIKFCTELGNNKIFSKTEFMGWETLIFGFKTEEEAFYFKLKYINE